MKNISIGRAPDNDLVLNDSKVSRYHARLYYRSGSWHLVDLQSSHGTSINDKEVEGPVKIIPSDKIKLSETKIIFDGHNLLSANGKILFPVVEVSSSSKKLPAKDDSTGSRVKILAFAGLMSTVLLVGSIFVLFNNSNTNPAPANQQQRNVEPITQHGAISYNNGNYSGELLNGLPHGFGTIEYLAAFRQDYSADALPHLRTIGAKSYSGYWLYGLKHGYGKKEFVDGSIKEGYWERGEYVGPYGN